MSIRREQKRAWSIQADLRKANELKAAGKPMTALQHELLYEEQRQLAIAAENTRVIKEQSNGQTNSSRPTGRTGSKKASAPKEASASTR